MIRRIITTSIPVLFLLSGFFCLYCGLFKTNRIEENGRQYLVYSPALSVNGVLTAAGIRYSSGDTVSPSLSSLALLAPSISIRRGIQALVWQEPGGFLNTIRSQDRITGNILQKAGIPLFPSDEVRLNGIPIAGSHVLPPGITVTLHVRSASPLIINQDNRQTILFSSAPTVGAALVEKGFFINYSDSLSVPAETAITGPVAITIMPAKPVHIQTASGEISTFSANFSNGEILSRANVPLQGWDYSLPEETAKPSNEAPIRLVRANRQVTFSEKILSAPTETIQSPDVGLDQQKVIDPGSPGMQVERKLSRLEDGTVTGLEEVETWVAVEPSPKKIGVGTTAVALTLDTPDGQIEYWRTVQVYATSYSPCRQGLPNCSLSTASGKPLAKGIIAVRGSWYSWMAGQRVYVPGYGVGVIADTGGGIPGKYWIDLGYGEEDFVNWHQTVIMYLLTPIPASYPMVLP